MTAINYEHTKDNSNAKELSQSLTVDDICHIFLGGCSKMTFWRLRKQDLSFPKPFQMGRSRPRWNRADVQAWYDATRANQAA